jgi:hypothetical protein
MQIANGHRLPILTAVLASLLFTTSASAENVLFWTLAGGAQAATVYDIQTTRKALQNCASCIEANPIMRPFVGSSPAAFSTSMGLTAGSIYASHKLKSKGVKWWWIPLAAQIGVHTAMGIRNSRLH